MRYRLVKISTSGADPSKKGFKLQQKRHGETFWRDVRRSGALKTFTCVEHGNNYINVVGSSEVPERSAMNNSGLKGE